MVGDTPSGHSTRPDPATVANLGTDVATEIIEGGNHEQMGWYTGQPDDPPATISRDAQQAAIVEMTISLVQRLSPSD